MLARVLTIMLTSSRVLFLIWYLVQPFCCKTLVKPFTIQAASLSSKNRRLIARFAEENTEAGDYTASVYLIAQIGKNYAIEEPLQISGGDLLNMALDKLRAAQDLVGGKLVLVEREADRAVIARRS